MAKMTTEQLVKAFQDAWGADLASVVLFGSAASGDHAGAFSDTNLLVVGKRLGAEDLVAVSASVARWVREGNPPPVFLAQDEIRNSADVFPIEYSDLEDARKVLFGSDPFESLGFTRDNLRAELEHELRGNLLKLRALTVASGGDLKKIGQGMLRSVSTFLVLFRAAVRLLGEKPPLKKTEALAILKSRVDFDDEVFRVLDESRRAGCIPPGSRGPFGQVPDGLGSGDPLG